MRIVSYRVCDLQNAIVPLGFAGENLHRRIVFKADDVYAEYPHAAASLTVRPPYGEPYPAVVARDGNDVLWDVEDSDLTRSGQGELQLAFTEGEVVCRTYVGKTRIGRSIIPTGDVPDPIEDFLADAGAALTAIPETIDAALEAAKESGEFDGPQGPAGQDGQPGADGYSPTITVTDITSGHRLTITDKNGTRTVDVMDGEDGQPGQDGNPGAPGFSPVITVTDITGGHRLTITTATGTQTVDVIDGSSGDPTTLIDDTAGAGVVNKTWSANKLNTETSALLSAIDDIYDANIEIVRKYTTTAEEDDYRLNESDGYKTANSDYKLVKYVVEAGKTVKVISDDRFQFQNSASVFISGTSPRIGNTYGAGIFYLTVPTGATYLIVSTPQTSAHAVYDYDGNKTYIDKTRYRISRADDLLTIHAYLDGNGKWVVQTAENELYCTDFIPVSSGEKIRYAGKAYSSRTIFGFYTSADPTANASSTVAGGGNTMLKEGEFTAPSNGYIRFATNMAGGGDYLIFDSRVSDVDAKKYEKPSSGIPSTDLASAVQTSLGKADTAYQKPSGGIPATDLANGVIPTVHNVPSGGTSGQVLAKASGTDYDLEWIDQTGGSGSDENIHEISDGILYELKTDRSETYEKNIPANALPWDAKLISIKGKSYLDGNSEAVVLAPSSITSFDANGDQVDSVSVSSVVSSVFDGKMASVNGIADEINFVSQKAYKRCAVKRFSECSWTAVTQGGLNFFRASSSGRRKNTNGWMEEYTESTVNYTSESFPDDGYYFPDGSVYIYVRDDSYQTVDAFLQAKGNTLIVTALETYSETPISLDDSIKIAPGGKIRFSNTDSLTVQNEIQYFIPQKHEAIVPLVPGDCLTIRNGLPTYYTEAPESPDDFEDDSYIDVKIESIPDGKHLIFFTDTHWNWGNNAQHSPALIQYVRKRTEIRNVLFGGDFINQATDKYLARQVLGDFSYKCLSAFEDGFLPVLGNHDTNLPGVTSAEQAATVYLPYWVLQKVMFGSLPKTAHTQYETDAGKMSGLTLTDDQEADLTGYMKTQYYYDDEAQKIRYIIVNSAFPKYGDLVGIFGDNDCRLSIDWVYSVLHSTPEGYDVALCIHQMGLAYNEGVFEYGSGAYYAFPSLLMGLKTKSVKELNFGASSNANLTAWWPHTKFAYDFTTCNDVRKVIVISGHSHCDCLAVITQDTTRPYRLNIATYDGSSMIDQTTGTALNGCPIPVLYTTTDAFGRYQDAPDDHETPMTEDTITEQAFDVITLRSGEIRMTRFGAGGDRVLYINA